MKNYENEKVNKNTNYEYYDENGYDWNEIHKKGFLETKHAERFGYEYGTEHLLYLLEDVGLEFEDPKATPRLLKKGLINAVRDELNDIMKYSEKENKVIQTIENKTEQIDERFPVMIEGNNINKTNENMKFLMNYFLCRYLITNCK